MRFMMLVKASKNSEAGMMPDDSLIAAMTKYNEEMAKAGILLDLAGLQPSSSAAQLERRAHQILGRNAYRRRRPFHRDEGADRRLLADPGQVERRSDRLGQAPPSPHGEGAEGEIELRQLFELEDFAPSQAIEDARRLETELANKK